MKEYKMVIKSNSTCPQKGTVLSLMDENKDNFTTIIGEAPIRGFYPVYIDSEDKQNLYGFVQSVQEDDGSECDQDKILDLIQNKPVVKLISHNGMMITATMTLSEIKAANVEDNTISPELQAAMDDAIAKGFVSKDEMDKRLAVLQKNRVDENLKLRIVKGYRKYRKPAHQPRTIYVDPFFDTLKPGEEGIIAEGLRCAVMRMPTIAEGEKSVGKNVYMETIAWLLGMPLFMIGFSRNMNPNAIYGEKSTDNSASEELRTMRENAIAKVMVDGGLLSDDKNKRNAAIKSAADFELAKARAASVSIITDASELYDWMADTINDNGEVEEGGGFMVWNGATCSVTSL